MSEIVDKWRSLQKGPRVPRQQEPPKTPRYDVKSIQSSARKQAPYNIKDIQSQGTYRTPRQMASLYPGLVAKRPELLERLAKRGVTYHVDPKLAERTGYAGAYVRADKTVTVQSGMGVGVAAHEVVHADLAAGKLDAARFLTDKRYRASRWVDIAMGGNKLVGAYFLVAGGIQQASLQSESFAMGAYGSEAYPGIPVDYTDANRLFGGSFEGR